MVKKQVILLGAPGSGKGTQAKRLVSELGYTHLSTGDLLRKEMSEQSDLGKRVTKIINEGGLVDDSTVLELLRINCDLNKNAYIFDGFPRNKEQAEALDDEVLKEASSMAVFFDIPLTELKERLVNRRTCGKCGAIYNLKTKPPKDGKSCDECGSLGLKQRKDDTEETVNNRLEVFQNTISPVLAYYEKDKRLKKVNATLDPHKVFESLKSFV